MEEYFQAKARLFNEIPRFSSLNQTMRDTKQDLPVYAIVNWDDPWGRRLTVAPGIKLWSYGQSESDFQFSLRNLSFKGSDVKLKTPRGEADFYLPIIGVHNAYNATAAIAACVSVGVPLDKAAQALEKFKGIPGRLEKCSSPSP